MKQLLLSLLFCAWAWMSCAQSPPMYIDNLVVKGNLMFTNDVGTIIGLYTDGFSLIYTNSEGPGWVLLNKDGVVYMSALHVLGVGSGAMVGDGSGLTNIMGTNIVGAVSESSHATNADIAVSASNATNLWGQITTTNLPPGVLTNNWNGGTINVTNDVSIGGTNRSTKIRIGGAAETADALNVTGAGRFSLGLVCNALISSGDTTAGASFWFRNGNFGLGSSAENTFTFVSGAYSSAFTDSATARSNWPTFGVTSSNNVGLSFNGKLMATNGFYYQATSNGVVSTNVIQPLHTFAALMGFNTNTINGGANTYAIVTNYSTARTNLMSCSLTAGTITNTIAGYYYCAIHMSMNALDAGALVEGDLLLNGVERDEISFQTQFDPGTPRYKGASAFGILYIPANSQITFQIKSSGASGIQLRRQQLVVMPP